MAKISVIIPCYNAEKYISTCFESLERQTIGMEQLEVIFVNDASTDSTLDLLCKFEKKYPDNVLVVNCAQNGRQGAARNIGLTYATAKYIGFADDDDSFEPEMFEDMWEKAERFQCDMVMCEFDNQDSDHHIMQSPPGKQREQAQSDTFYEIVTEEERLAFITMEPLRCIWNKLYLRELIVENHILFPEGYIYDDIYFYEMVKQYVKRVYDRKCVYYHHIFRAESASTDVKRKSDMMGYLDVELMLIEELKRRGRYDAYKDSYNEMLMLGAMGLIKTYMIRYGGIENVVLEEVKEKIRPYKNEILLNPLLQPIWKTKEDNQDKIIALWILGD